MGNRKGPKTYNHYVPQFSQQNFMHKYIFTVKKREEVAECGG